MKLGIIVKFLFAPLIALYNLNKKVFTLKNFFHIDNFIRTALILVLFWGLGNIKLEFLNPIGTALADVEITDMMYGQLGKNDQYRESNRLNIQIL